MSILPLILKNGVNTYPRSVSDMEALKNSMGIGTSSFVDVSSNQTINGIKVFSGSLQLPNSSGNTVGSIWRSGDALQYKDGANITKTILNSAGNLSNLADKQVSLNNLVNGQVANRVLRSNGTNVTLSQVALDTDVINVLPPANGGTGSNTQNFVDLTTTQNVAGNKTLSGLISFSNATNATSTTSAAVTYLGGVGIVGSAFIGGVLNLIGGQAQFPATQVPSTNVRVLDDYLEGTFTPTVIGLTTAGTGTYTLQRGNFLKLGRVVFFSSYVSWTAHSGTGNIRITGLPYASVNDSTSAFSPVNLWHRNFTLTANNVLVGYVLEGGTSVILTQVSTGGGAQNGVVLPSAGDIMISGLYFTVN